MRTDLFDYTLPPELIAQHPAEQRGTSRMLVLDRNRDELLHKTVADLPEILSPGDLLVGNDTRVIPARLFGRKQETGGKVEFLLLEEVNPGVWDCLMRCSRRPAVGSRILLGPEAVEPDEGVAEVLEDGEKGRARIKIVTRKPLLSFLEEHGHTPLPPYISRDWKNVPENLRQEDRDRYQTVYARRPGAVAAPTAGLHFTRDIFEQLEKKGVDRVFVTLHVGIGTFRPVKVDEVDAHRMDEERYEISSESADAVRRTREAGGRVVAIGSTSVRTLETVAAEKGGIQPASGRTDLFIHPPYTFRAVDAIITNFHLPKSTLLMMMSAFAGRERMLAAYEEAVREEYRFYSYGDCMLIL